MGRQVNERLIPGDTLADVRHYLQQAWDAVTPQQIRNAGMRKRCAAVIASNGGHTRY